MNKYFLSLLNNEGIYVHGAKYVPTPGGNISEPSPVNTPPQVPAYVNGVRR